MMASEHHFGPTDVGDVSPSEWVAGESTTREEFTSPLTHGVGVSFVLDDDVAAYDALLDKWRQEDREAGENVEVLEDAAEALGLQDELGDGEYVLLWSSSGWFGGDWDPVAENWTQFYKHHLKLRRRKFNDSGTFVGYTKPPVSLTLTVEPQRRGLFYEPDASGDLAPDPDPIQLPFGEGTRVTVQTTYAEEAHVPIARALKALRRAVGGRVDADRTAPDAIKTDSQRLWKAEVHVRFNIDRKHGVVRCLDKSEKLVDVGGASQMKTKGQRQEEGWVEKRVRSDRFDHLGFAETDYEEALKVYQAEGWHNHTRGEWRHHPKLEAYVSSTRGEGAPHLSEWDDVMDRLRELLCSHAEWAGLEEDDLVGDDFFEPEKRPAFAWDHPEGRREDLANYYNRFETIIWSEALHRQTDAVYDLLQVLVENRGATYDQLEAEVGLARSTLQGHVSELQQLGLVRTVGNPCVIDFDCMALFETAEEALDRIATRFGEETLTAARLGREERAEERRQRREERQQREADAEGADGDERREDADADAQEDGTTRSTWKYLGDWNGDAAQLLEEIAHGLRGEEDVRVRVLDRPTPGGGAVSAD
jgi:hypothetical protein